jgi:hypothetical protein
MNHQRSHRIYPLASAALLLGAGATAALLVGGRTSVSPANAQVPVAPAPAVAGSPAPTPAADAGSVGTPGHQGTRTAVARSAAPQSSAAGTANASAAPAAAGTVVINSQFTDPGELTGVQHTRCGGLQPGLCEFELGGHSRLTGTMAGWTDYTTWAHGNADGSQSYYTHETFTGTVAGCGRGTFDFVVEDGQLSAGPDSEDPAGRHFRGTWTMVPDSGTGDLARVSAGHGEEDGVAYPDLSLKGTFTGQLTCWK